jgi:hypothetical protein
MSVFRNVTLPCPGCGAGVDFALVASVNAGRAPELRAAILAETFQRESCPACGTSFRVDPRFSLIDHGRRQWIAALPLAARAHWAAEEATALASFERAYVAGATATIRSIGATLRRRVTFGWAGLREKLLCDELGLDDVELELCKLAVLRSAASAPVDRRTELRLQAGDGERLYLAWLQSAGEQRIETLSIARAACAEIAADAEGDWAELRAELSAGPFVDIARLTIAATPA